MKTSLLNNALMLQSFAASGRAITCYRWHFDNDNVVCHSDGSTSGSHHSTTNSNASIAHPLLKYVASVLLLLCISVGNAWGDETTYTFTNKSWNATSDGSAANWTSGKDGAGFSNNGIQVTTTATGANGTSPISFSNVTKVVCTYNTNKSKGQGTIGVQVGDNDEKSVNWKYSGKDDGTSAKFTATVDYATPQSGKVKITLNTTTNSIYLVSVTITYSDASTGSKKTVS